MAIIKPKEQHSNPPTQKTTASKPRLKTVLKAKKLFFAYPDSEHPIAENISLELKKGQITALMGPSGSGKSTLLHLLAGKLQWETGEILIENELLPSPKDQLIKGHPKIAVAFQQDALLLHRTVSENIAFTIKNWEKSFITEKTQELLQLCHLEKQAHQKVNFLSGGQKQRLALAMAIAPEPPVLLLDEPFSQIDLPEHLHLSKAIRAIADQGTAVLLVTHLPEDSLSLADELLILSSGSLIEKGHPKQLYLNPKQKLTAEILGRLCILNQNEKTTTGLRPENLLIGPALRQDLNSEFTQEFVLFSHAEYKGSFTLFSGYSPSGGFFFYYATDNELELNKTYPVHFHNQHLLHLKNA